MGVAISYGGRLKSPQLIPLLVEELIEIAQSLKWPYQLVNIEKEIEIPCIKGIIINPPECESLSFGFDEKGRLLNISNIIFAAQEGRFFSKYDYFVFCKTQFAGVEMHVKLVKTLKYLASKYFDQWECTDDSDYYDNGDLKKLQHAFGVIDGGIAALSDALDAHGDQIDFNQPEALESFIGSVLNKSHLEIQDLDEEE